MVLVDSSVWIDAFNGVATPQVAEFRALAGRRAVVVGDLILAEVLHGFADARDFEAARHAMLRFQVIAVAGEEVALQAARNFRSLRQRGITVRKTIRTLIATRCIADGLTLLHSDRDFDPFAAHLGLRVHAPARGAGIH